MRMRGLEPPPSCLDTDLNRARLPIPPHPRVVRKRRYSTLTRTPWRLARSALLASVELQCAPPSSRGLGRRPLTAVTRVRIPLAVLTDVPPVLGIRYRRVPIFESNSGWTGDPAGFGRASSRSSQSRRSSVLLASLTLCVSRRRARSRSRWRSGGRSASARVARSSSSSTIRCSCARRPDRPAGEIARMRGAGEGELSTDEILALTRR